ncbi:Histone acetyltransferase KAT2B [Papilio machaon]|uniref:Histone acetyltransferase KAT2B n=1 Tax=Papilio machaon TaxID=76193 RepID=A0A0N1PJY9_PAPMA|nr:Histone acetyltransferase KAT2B [Papilio machaon]
MRQKEIRKIHPGLTCFKEGVRSIPIECIPGLRDSGWRSTRGAGAEPEPDAEPATLRAVLHAVSCPTVGYIGQMWAILPNCGLYWPNVGYIGQLWAILPNYTRKEPCSGLAIPEACRQD